MIRYPLFRPEFALEHEDYMVCLRSKRLNEIRLGHHRGDTRVWFVQGTAPEFDGREYYQLEQDKVVGFFPTTLYSDIFHFHTKFGLQPQAQPRELEPEMLEFRIKFMQEELDEYINAKTLADRLDALVDLTYVVLGTAYQHGFNFDEAWRRVHAANMRKVRATSANDSKRGSVLDVVKPPDWEPPDLEDLCQVS